MLISRSSLRSISWLLTSLALLTGCEQASLLERIIDKGEIHIGSSIGPTTYYQSQNGPAGFEYELINGFTQSLGVEAVFHIPGSPQETFSSTRRGDIQIAAAGLPTTPEAKKSIRFSRPYLTTQEHLVYRRGSFRPRSLSDLKDTVHILPETGHEELLTEGKEEHPDLQWVIVENADIEDLISRVNEGDIKFIFLNEHELKLYQHLYPYIRSAFKIEKKRRLGWAFQKNQDLSLIDAADKYLYRVYQDGTLLALINKYYGATAHLNFVDKRDFWRHVAQRLPPLEDCFKAAEEETGIDWRLLAAVGYQESHWDPKAVSPTGVRGIMMLTQAAAKDIQVSDRRDPKQSILGGAQYLLDIQRRIPEHIPEPDRLWFSLAGYNVGFGHLEDARILTQRQSGNPDSWQDVKQRLPLLSQKKYYQTLKRGYARGREPVVYVNNIQRYYELMIWHTGDAKHQQHIRSIEQSSL